MGGTEKGKNPRQVEFGDRIREHRQRLNLSQESLALRAQVNRTYVASLEAGHRNPSLELICKLAIALNLDIADLVRGLQAKTGRANLESRAR
jgi:transcriptional regulator with XRE-family HTH domain